MNQCWNAYPVVLYFPLSHDGLKRAFDLRISQMRESGKKHNIFEKNPAIFVKQSIFAEDMCMITEYTSI